MNEYVIDPQTWFGEREVKFTPPHFVTTKTPMTPESRNWIYSNLRGRFSITYPTEVENDLFSLISLAGCPAFEDPKEALAYELKWA
jgi:hypothetical protein